MIQFAYTIIGFLVAITVLVAVHEYGHFWVARRCGVTVLKFSIGFGRPLLRWRRKNDPTEYVIGLIPLGGYVKMVERLPGDTAANTREDAFDNQPLLARAAIAAAGPASNFLFALLLVWLISIGGKYDAPPEVGMVAADSVAAAADFRRGDRLLEVDGRAVHTWGEHELYLMHRAIKGAAVDFSVRGADGAARQLQVDFGALAAADRYTLEGGMATRQIGLLPLAPPAEVQRLVVSGAAARAGLRPGDRILAADGVAIRDWGELVTYVSARPNTRMMLSVQRGDDAAAYQWVAEVTTESVVVNGREIGRIGLYRPPPKRAHLRYGPIEAVPATLDRTWRMVALTVHSVVHMVTAQMAPDNLAGPITIARVAGHTAASGIADFLTFMALISISLGLINLLPIPLLDGGHLLYFAVEAISGRPPSDRFLIWGRSVGAVLLMLLMSVAFYNDIMRLF